MAPKNFIARRSAQKAAWALAGLCFAQAGLLAQTVWLPGSDPINIGRSGAGVAFGRSLEACSLNPALLVTLHSPSSAYVAAGMEMQATVLTLTSNERPLYSTDRNRFVQALGAGWRYSTQLSFGLKVDSPFQRHLELPMESSSRFFGHAIELKSLRAEVQAAYAVTPALSLGLSAGMTRLDYASQLSLRAVVPEMPSRPWDEAANPAMALLEVMARQEGSATVPSLTAGFRYAATSRWTVAGSFAGSLKGRPGLSASVLRTPGPLYNTDGAPSPGPLHGSEERAQAIFDAMAVSAGDGDIAMPYKIQMGVRHRYNQFMTWELDLRYMGASAMELPGQPTIGTPSGTVSTLDRRYVFRDGLALSGMMEIDLNRDWTARAGISYDSALREGEEVEAMLGGAKNAAFSLGFGRSFFGGELSAGYQFRQVQNREANGVVGNWSVLSGLWPSGTQTRVEGMGHIWSVGYKKSF